VQREALAGPEGAPRGAAAGPAGVRGRVGFPLRRGIRGPLLGLPSGFPRSAEGGFAESAGDASFRRGAGALLPRTRPRIERGWAGTHLGRHQRPGSYLDHGEQRDRARPRAPAGRGRGGPAVAGGTEHQLPVQLRLGGGVLPSGWPGPCPCPAAAGGSCSESTPGPRRSTWAPAAGPGGPPGPTRTWWRCGRPTTAWTYASTPCPTSTADNPNALRARRPALGARRRRAELLPGAGTRRIGVPFGTPPTRSGVPIGEARGPRGRPPRGVFPGRAFPTAKRRRHAAPRRLPGPAGLRRGQAGTGGASPHRGRGPGRLTVAWAAWFWGFRAAGAWCRDVVSTVAKGPWVTGIRLGRGHHRSPRRLIAHLATDRTATSGGWYFLLLHRRPAARSPAFVRADRCSTVIQGRGSYRLNAARVGARHLKARLEALARSA